MLTDQQHPITPPPPELVAQIRRDALHGSKDQLDYELRMIHIAFRSGADQELEACCSWADATGWYGAGDMLRAARRPKPPSLAEQALAKTEAILNDPNRALLTEVREALELNRRALERLQKLESNG